MKAKQLPKGTWSKSIQYFYSLKNRAYFWCESLLERDALLLLEFDSEVESYKSQPISIQYKNEAGKTSRYTPDYLFKRKSTEEFIFREVKQSERVDSELLAKVGLINRRLKDAYGSRLEIITSDEIRVGSRIDNLSRLYSYRRVNVTSSEAEAILRNLPSEFCFAELVEGAREVGAKSIMPLALLAHGFLAFDTSISLVDATRIKKS